MAYRLRSAGNNMRRTYISEENIKEGVVWAIFKYATRLSGSYITLFKAFNAVHVFPHHLDPVTRIAPLILNFFFSVSSAIRGI